MAVSVEVLLIGGSSPQSLPMLHAIAKAAKLAGDSVNVTERYRGDCEWLVLYGVGAPDRNAARTAHVAKGGKAVLFDIGHFGERYRQLRFSINHEHAQDWLDRTPADPQRWAKHGIKLRNDWNERGPILLIGLGHKTRTYLGHQTWESEKLTELRQRFPNRRIVFRPKRGSEIALDCELDANKNIDQALKGVGLVVVRHSNVAIDATIAGVPFEAQDGAGVWLLRRGYSPENRLDFLRRLAWWQWKPEEAPQAWRFIKQVSACD